MIDLLSLSAALKQSLEIITGIKGLLPKADKGKSLDERISTPENIISDIRREMIRVQHDAQAMLDEKNELLKTIEGYKNWRSEAKRYVLTEIGPGVFVYSLIQSAKRGTKEPPHHICPKCFQDCKKSILQTVIISEYGTRFKCLRCQSDIFTNPGVGF
ncbi:MAG: hypothetical protein WCJ49_00975 [Deltaproteobacteria bacterium]|jgi:hypothetical protein